jgi:hypothetical protein
MNGRMVGIVGAPSPIRETLKEYLKTEGGPLIAVDFSSVERLMDEGKHAEAREEFNRLNKLQDKYRKGGEKNELPRMGETSK